MQQTKSNKKNQIKDEAVFFTSSQITKKQNDKKLKKHKQTDPQTQLKKHTNGEHEYYTCHTTLQLFKLKFY